MLSYGAFNTYAGDRIDVGIQSGGSVFFGSSYCGVWTTSTWNDGKWHHFAVVIPANASLTQIQIFIDGVIQAVNYYNSATINTANGYPLVIGRLQNTSVGSYVGLLNDIRIYNRALSVSEIQQLYSLPDTGPAPAPPTLVPTNRTPTSAEIGTQTSGSFKVFTNGDFVSGVALDPSKLTIVLTHGWNDSSDTWPSNMASQFVAAGISNNLVAWDWRDDAKQSLP